MVLKYRHNGVSWGGPSSWMDHFFVKLHMQLVTMVVCLWYIIWKSFSFLTDFTFDEFILTFWRKIWLFLCFFQQLTESFKLVTAFECFVKEKMGENNLYICPRLACQLRQTAVHLRPIHSHRHPYHSATEFQSRAESICTLAKCPVWNERIVKGCAQHCQFRHWLDF